jgi:hypothetical protein
MLSVHYAECHYAECHNDDSMSVIMTSVIILSVVMMNVIMLSVIMLSAAECRNAERHHSGCRYVKCRYAECRGTDYLSQGNGVVYLSITVEIDSCPGATESRPPTQETSPMLKVFFSFFGGKTEVEFVILIEEKTEAGC